MSSSHPLLLLHGAIGAADQLQILHNELASGRTVHIIEFPGHGQSPAGNSSYSIASFSEYLLQWMNNHAIQQADIFGYSMGGYVALHLALRHPDRIGKIMTLATKFDWNETTAAKEVKMLDPETIAAKIPAFAQTLEKRHRAPGWENVLQNTAALMLALGKNPELRNEDFPNIPHSVKVCIGDRDKMVSLEETIAVYRQLPQAQLSVFPLTPHPIEQVSIPLLVSEIKSFFV